MVTSGDTKAMGWLEQFGDIIMFAVCNARICKKREETLTSLLSVCTFYPKSRCIPPIISYSNNPDILLSGAKLKQAASETSTLLGGDKS